MGHVSNNPMFNKRTFNVAMGNSHFSTARWISIKEGRKCFMLNALNTFHLYQTYMASHIW